MAQFCLGPAACAARRPQLTISLSVQELVSGEAPGCCTHLQRRGLLLAGEQGLQALNYWDSSVTVFGILFQYQIEKFFPHVLEKEKSRAEGEPSILSPEEFAFAKE